MKLWNLKHKTVLIVDDFDEMRSLVRSMISPLIPDKVMVAKNGEEAIQLMEKTSFDIVLCDYNLGKGKDGQQVLEEARHRNLLNSASVFMMITAESTSSMVMGAIDYLPDDYISKPFTKTQLQNRLEKECLKKADLSKIASAIENKNYVLALSLCEQNLKDKPKGQTELLKSKGEILFKLGRLDDAEEYYETLLEERDIPWAKLSLGQIYYRKECYYEAEEIFESLINENPANVIAHDWLAYTLEKQGDLKRCQSILQQAIEKSPKSLVRQRKLAEIASQNCDHEVAEKAFERAISEGKFSCFRSSSDYAGLAKSMLVQGKPDDAAKTAAKINNEFEGNLEAQLRAATTNSLIHQQRNEMEQCEKELEIAFEIFENHPNELDKETALDITQTCLALNKEDKANEIVKHLVNNNMDDETLVERTMDIYREAGLSNEGEKIVQQTKQEVIRVNNEGAKLVKEGKLEESIDFFMKAVKGMPNNSTVNLNAAYSMIMQMQKTGKVRKYLSRALKHLEQAHNLDPNNQRYFQLMKMIQNLNSKAA